MIKTLAPWAVGVNTKTVEEAIAAAKRGGFQGLDFNVGLVADMGAGVAKEKFTAAGIIPAVFGVPFQWRAEEEEWSGGIERLPALADAAQTLGCTRCATWVGPASDDRAFDANLEFHVNRLRPVAEILGERGISLGLEFIGPLTIRSRFAHGFIFNMEGMLELAERVGPNVGLLLDSFHWYTSHGTEEQLNRLEPGEVVYVHVNDAVPGRTRDEQIDHDRRLPGETEVIDMPAFLRAVHRIGYGGPVTVEPFYSALNELPDDDARLHVVKESLDKVFHQAGL